MIKEEEKNTYDENEYSRLTIHECLILFKNYAPHSLEHKKANKLWKLLQKYLNDDEIHKLYLAWESIHLHSDSSQFLGVIHDLIDKYS